MNKKQIILAAAVLVALAVFVVWVRHRIHFDFGLFVAQISKADWRKVVMGLLCIYVGYIFRSVRWALLLRHTKRIPVLSLIGTQVIGFTAVALIGRVADLVRPYLVARRTGLELSSQIAVYVVERLFDFGAMGVIFSLAMLQVPAADIETAIHHSARLTALSQHAPAWVAPFVFRYGALILTLFGALFLVGIRLAGETIARFFESTVGLVSRGLGHSIGHKIRVFHAGLDTIRSFGEFATTAALSIAMWGLIALAYFDGMRAFTASRQLATINPGQCVLLMVVSGGASALQLPVLGWFTQIGLVAATITGFFGAAPEASTACAAMLLIVTFLGIVPVGLIWAQVEGVQLKSITQESERASEGLVEDDARALD